LFRLISESYFYEHSRHHIPLGENRDIRILGRVIEVVKKSVRRSYRECERIVKRSRMKSAKKRPTRGQQENAICKVAPFIKVGRQWYSVYRTLIDASSELVRKGDFEGFCQLGEHRGLVLVSF